VIERGELPREVEGLGIGRGGRREADPARRYRERRKRGDGLEPAARRLRHVLAERELVGEENRIEQRRLRTAREVLVVADVGECERRGRRMAPRRLMVSAAVDEQVEMQLPFHGCHPALPSPLGAA
jgi:hypothetical protein